MKQTKKEYKRWCVRCLGYKGGKGCLKQRHRVRSWRVKSASRSLGSLGVEGFPFVDLQPDPPFLPARPSGRVGNERLPHHGRSCLFRGELDGSVYYRPWLLVVGSGDGLGEDEDSLRW